MSIRRLSRLIPVGVWVLVIFVLSSLPDLGTAPVGGAHLDKLIHAGEYGILGFLFARAAGERSAFGRTVAITVLAGVGIGALDELYQSTVPGRDMDVWDAAADAVGATCGALAWVWTRRGRG